MTRVCHITSVHSQEDVRIFHKECVSLARNGYDVYLVQRGKSYEKNGVHIVGFGEVTGGRLKRITEMAHRAYKTALSLDADIYQLHDPELLPYALKLKRNGKKVIFDSHENTVDSILEKTWIPKPFRKMIYCSYKRYQIYVCQRLTAIITVTPDMTNFFCTINPTTVQVANFPIIDRQSGQPDFQSNTLVFAGGINQSWNHHVIIKALEYVPNCHYRLCGYAADKYIQELQQLPAWKRTHYLGKIPHEEADKFLASGCVGMALASYLYGNYWKTGTLGNTKVFEEMMVGLPVICTNFNLWREFVDRYHCGICVEPDDPKAIAAAIQYLLDNPEEARRMGENGRRAVLEEFNWGVEEKKLLALYEDILK